MRRPITRLCYTPTHTTRRLSLNEVRAFHRSLDEARTIEASGGLEVSTIIRYWGGVAWRSLRPCVFVPRRVRWQRWWDAGSYRRFTR